MMTLPPLLRLLAEAGARFPVDEWRVGRFHSWPMIRYHLVNANFELINRNGPNGSAGNAHRAVVTQMVHGARRYLEQPEPLLPRLPRAVDALFLSDGASWATFEGATFDRFCDPIVAALESRGCSTLTLVPGSQYVRPQTRHATFIQPWLDLARVAAFGHSRMGRTPLVHLPRYDRARAFFAEHGATSLTVEQLVQQARTLATLESWWGALLDWVRPNCIFVPCYIGAERQSLLAAAWRRGVPSVDVQHGAAGATHWAYYQHGPTPPAGYELLPSHFWCWDEGDAQAIDDWAGRRGPHHAIVAGVPLMHSWKAGAMQASTQRERLAQRFSRPGTKVAFILSGYEKPELIERLVTFAEQSPWAQVFFRTHPMRPEQQKAIEDALLKRRVDADVAIASEVALFSLLEHVDVISMELSSTAFEAARFGVGSVLLTPATGEVYRSLIERGVAIEAGADLSHAIRTQALQRGRFQYGPTAEEVEAGIEQFAALSRASATS